MTRASLTKLFILIILIFIICLPEFFPKYKVLQVHFLCVPYQDAETREGEQAKARSTEVCDPCLTRGNGSEDPVCARGLRSARREPGPDSGSGSQPDMGWFLCDTDMDVTHLYGPSPGAEVSQEVLVEFHIGVLDSLNLTLYGQLRPTSLHLSLPKEEEQEQEQEQEQEEGEKEVEPELRAFYCCLPVPPTSETTNRSRCLLGLTNQTALTSNVKDRGPRMQAQKDEWRCKFRVLWLALLCMLVLTVLTTVLGQVYQESCTKKPMVFQRHDYCASSHVNATGIVPHSVGSPVQWPGFSTGLSPIKEVDSPFGEDAPETQLGRGVDCQSHDNTNSYNAHLHHRTHPYSSSLTEEPSQ